MIDMLKVKIILGTMAIYNLNVGVDIELGIAIDQGKVMQIEVGDKEMVMVRSMVLGIRKDKEGSMEHQVLEAIPITQPKKAGELLNIHHQGALVVAREAMMEIGVIRVMVTRKSIEVPNIILRM